MTTEQPYDEDDALAAEYALRLLSGDELAKAKTRIAQDPSFASAVAVWEAQLASFADELDPMEPSKSAKRALMDRLFPSAEVRVPFWQRLGLWQTISLAALAMLAVFAWREFVGPPSASGPIYTAEIISETGDYRFVALVDKTLNEVYLVRTAGEIPEGRTLQVWSHGEGKPAQSVGLWPDGDNVRLPMPLEIAAVEGILTIGVSEEPLGGSPTGLPSGRVFGTVDIPGVTASF